MSKLRWERNDAGGLTLQMWIDEQEYALWSGRVFRVKGSWKPVAGVYKAKRGNRFVMRVLRPTYSGFNQYSAHSLREAMRMAKFFVGMSYG